MMAGGEGTEGEGTTMGFARWLRPRTNDHARTEGMAAGTGLLTGSVADAYAATASNCPRCRSKAVAIHVVDLVERRTDLCCQRCGHYWSADGVPAS
jgi:hypothetical protein